MIKAASHLRQITACHSVNGVARFCAAHDGSAPPRPHEHTWVQRGGCFTLPDGENSCKQPSRAETSKYPPAKPGALVLEPLKAACPCRTRQSVPSTLWNATHPMPASSADACVTHTLL